MPRTFAVAAATLLSASAWSLAAEPDMMSGTRDAAHPRATSPAADASADQSSSPAADPLAGPRIQERVKATDTLVERGPDGMIIRLDRSPVLAAIDLLDQDPMTKLDEATRTRVDKVILARTTKLDTFVRDNLLGINDAVQAGAAGDKAGALRGFAALMVKGGPTLMPLSLVDELKPALSAKQHERLAALVDEYLNAAIADRMKMPNDRGTLNNKVEATIAERLTIVGNEIKRSYERSVASGGNELDELLAKLDLTPEQEAKIRTRVTDAYINSAGKPGKAKIASVFLESWRELSPAQRQRLLAVLREQRELEQRAMREKR